MLSPAELWRRNQEEGTEANNEFGVQMKYEDRDGSFLQSKQLEYSLKSLHRKISQEKISKLGSLCIGEYDDECKRVVVKVVKGRIWSHFGYTDQGIMKLYPEEALFLMDVGTLRVSRHGVPLSMQEALFLFLKSDPLATMEHYLVYNYLNRLGYIIRRQSKNHKKCSSKSSQSAKKRKISSELIKLEKSLKYSSEIGSNTQKHDAGGSESEVMEDHNKHFCREISPISSSSTRQYNNSKDTTLKYTKFDFSQIVFPQEGGMRPISSEELGLKLLELASPKPSDSPNVEAVEADNNSGYFSFLDYQSTKQVSKAETWAEFKEEHALRLLSGQEEVIPLKDRHIPLVSDLDMSESNISQLLSKLKLSKTTSLQEMKSNMSGAGLMYDVHQPSPSFRKTDPSMPNHRLVVTTPESSPPSLLDLIALETESGGVPVYHAVSDNGDISFYHYAQEYVPPDLYEQVKSSRKAKHKNKNYNGSCVS
ncbi:tRNA-splicing endonuclease subunit Sen54-like isoform X2 [Watersipora subatra]|uniref:tRNA-splicing endonuclease subunit Sen54-like isoform X2 n=1 Tax=Watersipora subatra TaxID=2589382 RepID=UPI00355B8B8A